MQYPTLLSALCLIYLLNRFSFFVNWSKHRKLLHQHVRPFRFTEHKLDSKQLNLCFYYFFLIF